MDSEDQSQHIEVRVPSRTAKILDRRAEAALRRGRSRNLLIMMLMLAVGALLGWIGATTKYFAETSGLQRELEQSRLRIQLGCHDGAHRDRLSRSIVRSALASLESLDLRGDLTSEITRAKFHCHAILSRCDTALIVDYWDQAAYKRDALALLSGNTLQAKSPVLAVDFWAGLAKRMSQMHLKTSYSVACRTGADYCREIRSRAVRAVVLANLLRPFLRALREDGPEQTQELASQRFRELWDRVSAAASANYVWIDSVTQDESLEFVRGEALARGDFVVSSQEEVDEELAALQSHIERSLKAFVAAIEDVDKSAPSEDRWRAFGDLVKKLAYHQNSDLYILKRGS